MPIILALDLSTNTGYAVVDSANPTKLREYGNFVSQPTDFTYPFSYIRRAQDIGCAVRDYIENLCLRFDTYDLQIVIEEVNMSRARHSQKQLDFIHYAVCESIWSTQLPIIYVDTMQWRKKCGISLTKDQRKQNAKLAKAAREANKRGVKLDKKSLGITGKITKKHLAVTLANQLFNQKFIVKDNDVAEAALMAYAWSLGMPASHP